MSQDNRSEKHQKLSNPVLTFSQKLKMAVSYELEYWEDRQNPPNVPFSTFRMMVQHVPDSVTPRWEARKSLAGEHAHTAEDVVFNFEFPFYAGGREIRFYCKGYFFDKGNLKGVTIQSFRATKTDARVIPLRR